jgi:hypothetical protein
MDQTGRAVLSSAPAQAGTRNGSGDAILYVLACPLPERNGTPVYLMHQVGGVGCVLAYTDLDRLVACCGEHQPWLAVKLDALMADLRDQRLPGPVVNLPLSPDVRWRADGPPWDLAALAAAAGGRAGRPTAGGAG